MTDAPHGIIQGTLIEGTLRSQDLLRRFAAELLRLDPHAVEIAHNAHRLARRLDNAVLQRGDCPDEVVDELIDRLDTIAEGAGLRFGAHENDGADFGFWTHD